MLTILDLYLHKTGHLCTANRTLICLHSHDLRALNAQAHVTAWKNHGVLRCGEAYDTLSLRLISDVSGRVINTVDVIKLEDCVVIL